MPNPLSHFDAPLTRFTRDVALYSAFGAIPVGRLRDGHVVAVVAASSAIGGAATYFGLRARARVRAATPDGWMPWTPHAQSTSDASEEVDESAADSRHDERRREVLLRLGVAAAVGAICGGTTLIGIGVDRRLERFFANRGVRRRRLAVGLSQGLGYAALTAAIEAMVDAPDSPTSKPASDE